MSATAARAAASASGTFVGGLRRAGPGIRPCLPSGRARTITMRCGMPISSRSANITPGRSSRSSSSTSTPRREQLRVELLGRRAAPPSLLSIADRARARPRTARSAAGQMMPRSSWFCSIAAADDARDADAVAAHLHRLRLARSRRGTSPSSPPNTWCPAGRRGRPRCRARSRACPCRPGDGSPSTTLRMSATTSGSGRSRPQFTPVRWKPSSFAPQTKSAHRRDRAVGDDA